MYFLFFTDSIGQQHWLFFEPHSYPNLMEFVRDQGIEDWGDCRGRAWCGTCHISITPKNDLIITEIDEAHKLNLLSNGSTDSRLACQIFLNKKIHQMEIMYIGDD